MADTPRPDSRITRLLLDLAIDARQEYLDYLHAVAAGERPADSVERELLKARCDAALAAWRQAHRAWQEEPGSPWVPLPPA